MKFIGDELTWQELFKKQTDSGRFWKNLHKEEFDKEKFLMRSDAHYICYKAQSDILKNLSLQLIAQGVTDEIIEKIKKIENELWQGPNSVNECTKAFKF